MRVNLTTNLRGLVHKVKQIIIEKDIDDEETVIPEEIRGEVVCEG